MRPQGKAEEILSRFPGPVTLRASPKKWSAMLLVYAVFVAFGFLGIALGVTSGWFMVTIFGAFVLVAVVSPNVISLKLDRESFELTSPLRGRSIRWRDATGFEVSAIPPYLGLRYVMFEDANVTKRIDINKMRRLCFRLNAFFLVDAILCCLTLTVCLPTTLPTL
jgi:hypothetical protein